jgi:hypothetical protein
MPVDTTRKKAHLTRKKAHLTRKKAHLTRKKAQLEAYLHLKSNSCNA